MHLVTSNAMPVIRAVSLVLAHVPSLVRLGSKPLRVLREVEQPIEYLRPHLRDWNAARAYAPNQVFIGNVSVDELASRPVPWHRHPVADADRFGPDGEIMSEDEFLGLLATCDGFDLLALTGEVADRARSTLDAHPVVGRASGRPTVPAGVANAVLDERIARHRAVPLVSVDGRLLGAMLPGHDDDDTLTGQVLLENLTCKATAALALRHLLARPGAIAATDVRYVINCGEEAVGDRYQRGGGNVAKAVAEWAGCARATGSDVKAFCCGPMHALMLAGALVRSGLDDDVVVLTGRDGIDDFVRTRGMPGFSPTQGHIASAIPYLGHALRGLTAGRFTRTMFTGKGSLFLGRMTQLSDGVSLVLERNGARAGTA